MDPGSYILAVLLIVSLAIHVIQAIWTCRVYRPRRNKKTDSTCMSPDCTVALDSNPCYEASNVKQTEAQEAVHVYEMVKQHN
jgi:hypothetical protein